MNQFLDKLGISPDHFPSWSDTPQRLRDLHDAGWRVQTGAEHNDGFAYGNEFWVISPDGNESQVFASFAVVRFLSAKADELSDDEHDQTASAA